MIRNEQEYRESVERLRTEQKQLQQHRKELESHGIAEPELQRLLDPLMSFHVQLKEEVESYERLRRGELSEVTSIRKFGHALTCLRIAKGITQQELAARLGVHASQVSRDERNEYHGITLERAAKVLEALGVKVRMNFEIETGDAMEATAAEDIAR